MENASESEIKYEVMLTRASYFDFDESEELIESGLVEELRDGDLRLTLEGVEDRVAYAKSLGHEIFYSVESKELTAGAVQTTTRYYANLTRAEMEKLSEYGGYYFEFALDLDGTELYIY